MRKIHLVGTFPQEVTSAGIDHAFSWALGFTDEVALVGLPCDLDDRWIIRYLDSLDNRPQLRAVRTGDSEDYDRMPVYRPVRGRTRELRGALVNHAAIAHATDLARTYLFHSGRPPTPLQLSRPNPLDLSLFTFCGRPRWRRPLRTARGAWLAIRHLPAFRAAFAEESGRMRTGADVPRLWQVESPAVLYALNLMPRVLRRPLASLLARQVADVLTSLPAQDGRALHLCYGDLRNTAIIEPSDTSAMVLFLNALGGALRRRGTTLPQVHLPFAWGAEPPPVDASYYRPLRQLRHDWLISAGVVSEADPSASVVALRCVEKFVGRPVDAVGKPCGLGRHELDRAEAAMRTSVLVATVPAEQSPAGDRS